MGPFPVIQCGTSPVTLPGQLLYHDVLSATPIYCTPKAGQWRSSFSCGWAGKVIRFSFSCLSRIICCWFVTGRVGNGCVCSHCRGWNYRLNQWLRVRVCVCVRTYKWVNFTRTCSAPRWCP